MEKYNASQDADKQSEQMNWLLDEINKSEISSLNDN